MKAFAFALIAFLIPILFGSLVFWLSGREFVRGEALGGLALTCGISSIIAAVSTVAAIKVEK